MISEQLPRTAPDEFVIGAASGQEGVPREAMTLWIGRSSFTIGTARMVRDAMVGDGTFFVRNETMRVAADGPRGALHLDRC